MRKAVVPLLFIFLAGPGISHAARTSEPAYANRPIWPAAEGQPLAEANPDQQQIVRFIEAIEGEFTIERVEGAVDTVFADLAEIDVEGLPEFLGNISALGLSADADAALRARLLAIVQASALKPEAKDQARAAITAAPPAMLDTATLPYDGVCSARDRMADPDCPPLVTGPMR